MSVSSETTASLTPSRTPLVRAGQSSARSQPSAEESIYGLPFWYAYVANSAFTVAMALMYRYADFVLFLKGDEWNVGLIVGVGMVGSLVMRFFQGFGIDHFGARIIWLGSIVAFIVSVLGHLLVTDVNGPAIFALRILYATSLAGVFGASISGISGRLPLARMTEVIGTLGTSGFIGMALGPVLGDYLCGHEPLVRSDLNNMFLWAAGLAGFSFLCAEMATRRWPKPVRRRKPPMLWLIKRYHPGSVMLLAVMMGIGFVIPTTFLPAFIKDLNIENTGTFFIIYASTAFLARLSTRRIAHVFGVNPLIYAGMASLALSLLTYLPVTSQWGLAIPGVFAGIAHAVLFPSVTAKGSTAFPSRYRGLGTTLMLAMLDTGTLIGAPLVGRLVELSKHAGVPPYSATFVVLSTVMIASGIFYAITDRKPSHG